MVASLHRLRGPASARQRADLEASLLRHVSRAALETPHWQHRVREPWRGT
jgi:hypothetical protein